MTATRRTRARGLELAVKTDLGFVVWVARTHSKSTNHAGIRYTKRTYPLVLGYAMTGHKAQGATIDKPCIVHVRDGFAPGLVYTMFSRVTRLSHLRVVDTLTPDDCQPMLVA